jgi:hypothetical protein
MLDWVDYVLKPYVATAPVGIIPILFLDSFKVHLLGSVANAIQGLGVELEIIPPAAPVSCSQSTSELTSHSRRT